MYRDCFASLLEPASIDRVPALYGMVKSGINVYVSVSKTQNTRLGRAGREKVGDHAQCRASQRSTAERRGGEKWFVKHNDEGR